MLSPLPDWVDRSFRQWFRERIRVQGLLFAGTDALSRLSRVENLNENDLRARLYRLIDYLETDEQRQRAPASPAIDAGPSAELTELAALLEVTERFRTLLSQAVIALWDSLEAFVLDFIAEWLKQIPEARTQPAVQKIKISLSKYEDLTI